MEDIFQPTGISIKPSENLLKDFSKRAKKLNREKIFNIIMEKVNPYKEYPGNSEKTKLLTKSLYLIEHLVEEKVEDLYDAFDERVDLFEDIRKVFSTNRKIVEITTHILKMYNATAQNDGYNQIRNENQQQEQGEFTQNANLIEIDDVNENPNLLVQDEGKSITQSNQTNINLLEDIFGMGSGNQGNPVNQNMTEMGKLQVEPNKEVNYPINAQETKLPKKGFDFIKSKQTNQNPPTQDQPKKQGFSFIKNKETKTKAISSNELNSIFSSNINQPPSEQTMNFIGNQNPLELVFSQQPQIPTVDLTKIQTICQETPKTSNEKSVNNTFTPQFNYEHVYQNTNGLKDKNSNDPFSFVQDMIKAKK